MFFKSSSSASSNSLITDKAENEDKISPNTSKFINSSIIDSSIKSPICEYNVSKYNLNKEGISQVNATYSETACAFSSKNYWETEDSYIADNLSDVELPDNVTSIITIAEAYGERIGGKGRLIIYEETWQNLGGISAKIFYGTDIGAVDGRLYWWLGSAYDDYVYHSDAIEGGVLGSNFGTADKYGIRPVVEILKSKIK